MSFLTRLVKTSLGKKYLMSFTGLFLCFFLLMHLTGNFLLYVSAEAFNAYAELLNSTSLIYVAEAILLATLIIHVVTAIILTRENRKARPQEYAYKAKAGRSTWMSAHMMHTGVIILVFLIVHLWTFKFDQEFVAGTKTLYEVVAFRFSNLLYSSGYIIAMFFLGLHLHHAFQSAFQTLGWTNAEYTPVFKKIGTLFSIFVAVGFASFPVYFYLLSLGYL